MSHILQICLANMKWTECSLLFQSLENIPVVVKILELFFIQDCRRNREEQTQFALKQTQNKQKLKQVRDVESHTLINYRIYL